MADILELPTAANQPVRNHRRRGSYGSKIVSFESRRRRRESEERQRAHALQVAQATREKKDEDEARRNTVSVLRVLLSFAQRGTISSVAVVYDEGGVDEVVTTGAYRDASRLTKAALRASWKATKLAEEE